MWQPNPGLKFVELAIREVEHSHANWIMTIYFGPPAFAIVYVLSSKDSSQFLESTVKMT